MTCKQTSKILILSVFAAAVCANVKLDAQPFSIPWYTIDSGGGTSAGGNFELHGTIGQHDAGAVMSGGNFTVAGGFWPGVAVEPEVVLPVDFQVVTGSLDSGGVTELLTSDDQYVVMDPVFSSFRYQLVFTVDSTSPTLSPSALQFNIESKTFNIIGSINQRIELFNFNTGQFQFVDLRQASISESVVTVTPSGDPTRFVHPTTGAMRARLRYENGFLWWVYAITGFFLPFETSVDQIFWSVTP